MSRDCGIADFLRAAGWADATRRPLAGDASARRYERLTRPDGHSVILMDADPTVCGSLDAFLAIRLHLCDCGFSAPEICAADAERGLLLIEDFGDALFARVMAKDPSMERPLYMLAADLLARLGEMPLPPGLAPMSANQLATMIAPAFEAYAPDRSDLLRPAVEAFEAVLTPVAAAPQVLALRDFHAENLIHLPERSGFRQAGLLDFQDAFVTHHAYDLVSMLQDARRDVSADVAANVTDHFIACTRADRDTFLTAFAALGAQRNLRILGIFARLAAERGKPRYLTLQPRVWRHLQTNLAHPALARVCAVLQDLPAPEVAT